MYNWKLICCCSHYNGLNIEMSKDSYNFNSKDERSNLMALVDIPASRRTIKINYYDQTKDFLYFLSFPKIRLVLNITKNSSLFQVKDIHMYFNINKKLYFPPLLNIRECGSLCLDVFQMRRKESFDELVDLTINSIFYSKFNQELDESLDIYYERDQFHDIHPYYSAWQYKTKKNSGYVPTAKKFTAIQGPAFACDDYCPIQFLKQKVLKNMLYLDTQ